jgi:hypothetical protein
LYNFRTTAMRKAKDMGIPSGRAREFCAANLQVTEKHHYHGEGVQFAGGLAEKEFGL